jgi:phosphoribosylformylglycinamidine cyclo-ligase
MRAGDALIGVYSSGIHANGFSLVRKVIETAGLSYSAPAPFAKLKTLGEALLTPTRLYVRGALAAIAADGVKGIAHITGGGITGNVPRVLPDGLDAAIDLSSWRLSPVFAWLAREADLAQDEMLSTFNCRVGLIAVADPARADAVIAAFEHSGEIAHRIGELIPGKGEPAVHYRGILSTG